MSSEPDYLKGPLRSVFERVCNLPETEDPREWSPDDVKYFLSGFSSYLQRRREGIVAKGESDSALIRTMSCIRVILKVSKDGLTVTTYARFLLCPTVNPDDLDTAFRTLIATHGLKGAQEAITLSHVQAISEMPNLSRLGPSNLALDIQTLAFEDISQAPKINALIGSDQFARIEEIRDRLYDMRDTPLPLIDGVL